MISKKRGISTIIGGSLFGIIIVSAFVAFIALMETNIELLNTQIELSGQEIERIREDFSVFASDNGTGINLVVYVENDGKHPVEMSDLWIINKSSADCPPCDANIIEIDFRDSFIPPQGTKNILENTQISLSSGMYDLKAVTSHGNVETITLLRTGGTLLSSTLYANPSIVPTGGNTTLILNVRNNSTITIYNVTASQPTVEPITALDGGGVVQSTPFSIQKLEPNESFDFSWNYQLLGASGTTVTFTTNTTGHKQLNSNPTNIETLISNNSNTTTQLSPAISSDLSTTGAVAELFAIVPGPVGDSQNLDSRGFWGVVVVNPTNQTLFVHRVELGAHSNRQNSDKVFDETFNGDEHVRHIEPCCIDCSTNTLKAIAGNLTYLDSDSGPDITPNIPVCDDNPSKTSTSSFTGVDVINNDNYTSIPDGKHDPIGNWDIPRDNNLVWTGNVTYPMMIPPYDAQAFIVKMASEAGGDIAAFIVAVNAQTSFGLFTEVGHASSARKLSDDVTIINVYPTDGDVSGNSTQSPGGRQHESCYIVGSCEFDDPGNRFDDDNFEAIKEVSSGESTSFYVTVREGQDRSDTYIDGANDCTDTSNDQSLIISLPPGFPDVTFTTVQTGFCPAALTTFADGTKLIRAPIASDVGDHGDQIDSDSTTNNAGDAERITFTFSTTAPTVTEDTIYTFFSYVDGFDTTPDATDNPIGPISEAVVLIIRP